VVGWCLFFVFRSSLPPGPLARALPSAEAKQEATTPAVLFRSLPPSARTPRGRPPCPPTRTMRRQGCPPPVRGVGGRNAGAGRAGRRPSREWRAPAGLWLVLIGAGATVAPQKRRARTPRPQPTHGRRRRVHRVPHRGVRRDASGDQARRRGAKGRQRKNGDCGASRPSRPHAQKAGPGPRPGLHPAPPPHPFLRGPLTPVRKEQGRENEPQHSPKNAPAHSIFCSPDGVLSVTVYALHLTAPVRRAARGARRATGREVRRAAEGARAKAMVGVWSVGEGRSGRRRKKVEKLCERRLLAGTRFYYRNLAVSPRPQQKKQTTK
jgi:hypothetical protein